MNRNRMLSSFPAAAWVARETAAEPPQQAVDGSAATRHFSPRARCVDVVEALSRRLQRDPRDADALLLRGKALLQLRRYDEAAADLAVAGGGSTARLQYAVCHARLGNYAEAAAALETVLRDREATPAEHGRAALELAACHNALGDLSAAVDDYVLAFDLEDRCTAAASGDGSPGVLGRCGGNAAFTHFMRSRRPRSAFGRQRSRRFETHSAGVLAVTAAPSTDLICRRADPSMSSRDIGPTVGGDSGVAFYVYGDGDAGAGAVDPSAVLLGGGVAAGGGGSVQRRLGIIAAGDTTNTTTTTDELAPGVAQDDESAALAQQFYEMGLSLRKGGEMEKAASLYTRALERCPQHFRALFDRGFCLDRAGSYRAALADYRAAARLAPDNAFVHYNLGTVLDRIGAYEEAEAAFSTALRLQPGVAPFHHNRGLARQHRRRLADAVEDYTAALALCPGHVKSLSNRAACLSGLGHFREALEDYAACARACPRDPTLWCRVASVRERAGDESGAVADYTRALQLAAASPEERDGDALVCMALCARAGLYQRLQRLPDALADLDQALSLRHDDERVLRARASVLRELGRWEDALRDYEALPLPADAAAAEALLADRALAYRRTHRHAEAIGCLDQLLRRQQGDGHAAARAKTLLSRGYVHARAGNVAEALSDYSAALQLTPRDTNALYNRGVLRAQMGDARGAAEDLGLVIEWSRDAAERANALYSRGAAHAQVGERAAALRDLSAALELDAASFAQSLSTTSTSGVASTGDDVIAARVASFRERHPATALIKSLSRDP